MPAIWDPEAFVAGGMRGIQRFSGALVNHEEDVEGRFGKPQIRFEWSDAVVLETESDEEIVLEDGKFTDWVTQQSGKNSTNKRMVEDMAAFCKANDINGSLPNCLYELPLVWERATYEYEGTDDEGKPLNPGRAFIPGAYVEEDKPKDKPKAKGKAATKTSGDESPNGAVPAELRDFILETVGTDGATRDIIRREVVKKTAMRTASTKFGGFEKVLAAVTETGVLAEDDGYYVIPD